MSGDIVFSKLFPYNGLRPLSNPSIQDQLKFFNVVRANWLLGIEDGLCDYSAYAWRFFRSIVPLDWSILRMLFFYLG